MTLTMKPSRTDLDETGPRDRDRRPVPLPVLTTEMTFDTAARLVLDYLNDNVPMAMWSVTRVADGRQIYLYVDDDNEYGVTPGASGVWEDTFCVHMAAGTAPPIAPSAMLVPEYAAAAARAGTHVGAYAGAVISEPGGSLFGAICGVDPNPQSVHSTLTASGPLICLLAQLLSMVVSAERAREHASVAALEASLAEETDRLTGLYNRRAWDLICQDEARRFERLADPTVVLMLDLDGLQELNDTQGRAAGDRCLELVGEALRASVKSLDVTARLGGDEFAVLLRGCPEDQAESVVQRLYAALAVRGVTASIGWAPMTVLMGYPGALAEADTAMHVAKTERRRSRTAVAR